MKALFAIACCLFIISCAPVLYTHEQVMSSFHTKDDLISRWGLPSFRREVPGYAEWFYVFGRNTRGGTFPIQGTNISVTSINTETDYLKFILDYTGTIQKWTSHNVDLTVRQRKN